MGADLLASVGTISIGLKVVTREFAAGLSSARAGIAGFAGQLRAAAAVPLAIGGGVVAAGLTAAVKAGSDLNETLSKTGVIFGSSAGVVVAAADDMAQRYGVVRTTFLDAADDLGQVGKAAGLTTADAAAMGVQFAKLGADVSSISNKALPDVLAAIKSGLTGAAEPLRQFGVLLSEDAVKLGAARLGIASFGKELTDGQKVQARAALIAEQLQYAVGDLDRTASGVANSFRALGGRLQNFVADMGALMQPVAESSLGLLNAALADFSGQLTASSGEVAAWADQASAAGGRVFEVWTTLGMGVGKVADVVATVRVAFVGAQAGMTTFGAIGLKSIAGIVDAIDWLKGGLVELLRGIYEAANGLGVDLGLGKAIESLDTKGLANSFREMSKGLMDEAGAEWKAFLDELGRPPPSEGIEAWFAKIRDQAEAAATRAKELAEGAKIEQAGPPAELAKKKTLEEEKIELEKKKKLGAVAKKAFEEQQTPLEKMALKFKEIDEAVKAGMLTSAQADRIKRQDAREYASASMKSGAGGAIEARSTEAFNAFVAYQASRADPMRNLPDLTRLGLAESEKQTKLLETIAKLTGSTERSIVGIELPE